MSSISISFHFCKNLKVSHSSPKNSNALGLTVETNASSEGKRKQEIMFYGLPKYVTDALCEALRETVQDQGEFEHEEEQIDV